MTIFSFSFNSDISFSVLAIECNPLNTQDDWAIARHNTPVFWNYDETENVPFGETVYMNCTVDGADPSQFMRSRKCLYDVTLKEYLIIGDKLDCGGRFSNNNISSKPSFI